ncbi:unnamed protein product [Rotaria sp. Silwood1]|nr:unnamed protein product [Rotaria sp. Silwood1]CAF4668925.1 unnamed protein product [Rotaria sp. Silwood1]
MLNEQFASNNITKQSKDKASNVATFFTTLGKVNKFLEYTFSLPMKIYQNIVDNIYNLVVNNTGTCAMCVCTAVTTTVSVTSIAVGVGIGAGIGCFPSDSTTSNSTSG